MKRRPANKGPASVAKEILNTRYGPIGPEVFKAAMAAIPPKTLKKYMRDMEQFGRVFGGILDKVLGTGKRP